MKDMIYFTEANCYLSNDNGWLASRKCITMLYIQVRIGKGLLRAKEGAPPLISSLSPFLLWPHNKLCSPTIKNAPLLLQHMHLCENWTIMTWDLVLNPDWIDLIPLTYGVEMLAMNNSCLWDTSCSYSFYYGVSNLLKIDVACWFGTRLIFVAP